MAKYLEMFGKRYGEIIVKTTVLRWLTLVGAVLTLIVTVLMWVRINQQNVSYEEVEAKIVSAEKRRVNKRYH